MRNLSESTLKETILRGYLAGTIVAIVGVICQYIAVRGSSDSVSMKNVIERAWSPGDMTAYQLMSEVGHAFLITGFAMIVVTFSVRQFSVFIRPQL